MSRELPFEGGRAVPADPGALCPPDRAPERARGRIVALHLPDFPLQRVRRGVERGERPPDDGRPLAIVADGRIACCDRAARAAGVRPGATVAEALAACGRLATVPLDAPADRGALRGLAEALLGLAPAVEISGPDALLLDAGAAHLLAPRTAAPADGERILAERAIAAAAEMGYAARAAIATGRAPARALAVHAAPDGAPLAVPPDATARALGTLPLGALGLSPPVVERLAGLGVRDAAALARLPAGVLAHRFGAAGIAAARLARGEDDSRIVPYVPEALPEEALELEAPAESAEPLLFALKRLAERVATRLAGRALGATRLKIVLRLDPRGEERIVAPLAAPSASAARWLLPLKEHLFSLRLPGAVTGLRLAAIEVAPVSPEQLAIGDRPETLAALEGVLSRLAVRLGDGALFAAEPVDRYRPEGAYRPVPFRPPERARVRAVAGGTAVAGAPPRPTRLLPAPVRIVAEGEGGRVTAIRLDGCARAVVAMAGPERLRGEWWGDGFDRDYYRVQLEGVGDCWVFRDGGDGRLYLHGFFD